MATQINNRVAYGLSDPTVAVSQAPIIAHRNPTSSDKAQLGAEWINAATNQAFVITLVGDNIANWEMITASGTSPSFITDSGTAVPAGDTLRVTGSGSASTSGSGNVLTIHVPVASITLDGDSSSASGSTVNVVTGFTSGPYANGTPQFVGDGASTLTWQAHDGQNNCGIGNLSLQGASAGFAVQNTAFGNSAGFGITDGQNNVLVGIDAGNAIASGSNNVAVGAFALSELAPSSLGQGVNNLVLGSNAGINITTTESDNIYLNSAGTLGESNTLRIGNATGTGNYQLNKAFICGVNGVNVGSTAEVVTMASDQLGTATITAGSGITVTPSANTITIATTGSTGGAVTFHTGSGDATTSSNAITIAGGNNISTTGSGSTVTVNVAGTTNHAVQIGNSTNSLTSVAVGTTNQVLLGNTGANPSWGTVPNAALTNSSITLSSGANITVTGSPVSLGGTATIAVSGQIPVANGGTGVATIAAHSLLIGEGTSAIANTGAGTAGQIIVSGGASADPAWVTPTAGTGLSVTTNASTLQYALSTPVSIANGGTNATSMATTDGVVYYDGTRLVTTSAGTSGQVLTSNGAGVAPTYQAAGSSGITTINGNSGSVTGSTVTLTTGASNANGTAKFTGSSATMTMTFSDASNNLALGSSALSGGSLTGARNNCIGNLTGVSMTSGSNNNCLGYETGNALTSGNDNIFIGEAAGLHETSGSNNIGIGSSALQGINGAHDNTAIGFEALDSITTGIYNVALGSGAGSNYTGTESSNISINALGTAAESHKLRIGAGTGSGTQQLNGAFISGIQTITVTGTAVLVSSSDQLGIAVSSQRFKSDIQSMTDESDAIYKLRPVMFNWDRSSAPGLADAPAGRQYGLIAEEVAQVLPQMVGFEKDGKPLNVHYGDLTSLLVNEIQKLNKRIEILEAKVR